MSVRMVASRKDLAWRAWRTCFCVSVLAENRKEVGRGGEVRGKTDLPHNLDISRPRPVIRRHGIDHPNNVPLHHADVILLSVLVGHIEKVLDEVHDVGSHV